MKFGYIVDNADNRDLKFAAFRGVLPPAVDLRATRLNSPIRDQGDLGSCVGNATASAFEYAVRKSGGDQAAKFSALAIYWSARFLEQTVFDDAGCMIRDAIKAANARGVLADSVWPYNIARYAEQPPFDPNHITNKLIKYRRVAPAVLSIKSALALGYPVIFGIRVFESIESVQTRNTGYIAYPRRGEIQVGGHCMLALGYDDATQTFLGANSWGTSWGKSGYFTIPYKYLGSKSYNGDNWIAELL
jgi:C1A family cysteine protease